MNIRKYEKRDIFAAAALVSRTYSHFNKREGSKNAIQSYVDFFDTDTNLENIKTIFSRSEIVLVAEQGQKIIGFLRGNRDKLFNLFVDGNFHRRGIGRELMLQFEKEAAAKGACQIKIRASIYAVPFYESVGYKKSTGIRTYQGLQVQPMIKKL